MSSFKKRRYITIGVCVAWILVIFIFSAMNSTSSSNLTDEVLKIVEYIRARNQIVNSFFTYLTQNHSIFYVIRKMAHMFVFCVLQIITFNIFRAFKNSFIKSSLLSVLFVFTYACLDEFHQLFVDGRAGLFSDVIIDTIGGMIGLFIVSLVSLVFYFIKILKQKYFTMKCCKNK